MFTIKIISSEGIEIFQSPTVSIVDEHHPELKAHIADCNIKSANISTTKPVRHDDMKAAVFADAHSLYLYPGDRCYITNDEGKTVHSLNYATTDKKQVSAFAAMIAKLAKKGGCIISSADCSELEISDARVRNDFYVTELGYGYVRRLPEWLQKHSRFARGAADNNCEERKYVKPDIDRVKLATDANELYHKVVKALGKKSFGMTLDILRDSLEEYYDKS